ncbi:APH-domain-containing protein [Gloeophyllum trabeum ATCC 11539]|uniref:APH-domain-containing protein n=1 Tax=Gloeophyllum trabeum (strain ATCC 11539 / FP-39264 / Madison 617) TaxID=670483 RepID=S7Q6Y1_GLOTA|nr:APH-domain-containing protein [Gloeophyllum trabeum ATCC 11539]EPQ55193.1 APH-domain-containing protein [Gloeophyllum trabeum ATCC 11539]
MSKSSSKIGGEYGEVRATIDVNKLNAYLKDKVPRVKAPVDVKQFKFGQSNPTYFLTDASNTRWVLRKKPAGQLLSTTAHQIEREYTILNAIHRHNVKSSTPSEQNVPVPEPIILCEDKEIIGTPFYIMEFLDGRIFTNPRMPEIPENDRRECWLSAVRALAALSSLVPQELGLSNFAPMTPYFPRQIKSLSRVSQVQSEAADVETGIPTGKIPKFDEMIAWYRSHLPDESKTGSRIVHGDYKIDNMIFHPTENRVIGILDWELCTLGSPLADLANLTQPWSVDPSQIPEEYRVSLLRGFKNQTDDIPIDLETLEREYCRLTHQPYPITEMVFARSWMLFRLSVISQGIAARYARRQASSEQAFLHVKLFPIVGELAIRVLEDAGHVLELKSKL